MLFACDSKRLEALRRPRLKLIAPAGLPDEAMVEASPDLMRSLPHSAMTALLLADAGAACGGG